MSICHNQVKSSVDALVLSVGFLGLYSDAKVFNVFPDKDQRDRAMHYYKEICKQNDHLIFDERSNSLQNKKSYTKMGIGCLRTYVFGKDEPDESISQLFHCCGLGGLRFLVVLFDIDNLHDRCLECAGSNEESIFNIIISTKYGIPELA